jgi:hypothetical protein
VRRRIVLALSLALAGGAALAGPVQLTPDELRDFGSNALARGYAQQALGVAEALLRRDPGDALALVLKAQALRLLGDLAASEAAARAAWAMADTPAEHYGAATALAQALSLQDQRTRAQYWLRQAVQHAPNAATKAQAVQDFAYVRDQNPLSLQVDATARPSNNVNGGARDPLFEVHGIPFVLSGDALALSGVTWGLGVTGSFRLSDDGRRDTALTFGASHQGVLLSQAAQVQAPGAENGDYALSSLQLGLRREVQMAHGTLGAALQAGHSWYGGADLANSLTARLDLERKLEDGAVLNLGAQVTGQDRLDHDEATSLETGLTARYALRGPQGDSWQIGLNLARIASDDISVDHDEAGLTLGWQAGKTLAGLGLGAQLSARLAEYDASPYTSDGRQDLRFGLGVTATLKELTYLGFAPVLSLDMARNASNVARFDTETMGLSLSVKSRF